MNHEDARALQELRSEIVCELDDMNRDQLDTVLNCVINILGYGPERVDAALDTLRPYVRGTA